MAVKEHCFGERCFGMQSTLGNKEHWTTKSDAYRCLVITLLRYLKIRSLGKMHEYSKMSMDC
jgi:hypothetical protein